MASPKAFANQRNRVVQFTLPVLLVALVLSFATTTAALAAGEHSGLSAADETGLSAQGIDDAVQTTAKISSATAYEKAEHAARCYALIHDAAYVQGAFPISTGLIPEETPVPTVHDANESPQRSSLRSQGEESLPAQFSSVDAGHVTSVKNQDALGTCWAFAAISCIESSMLAHGQASDVDFSERHLAYFTNNPTLDRLGNTAGDKVVAVSNNYGRYWETASYLNAGGNSRWAANALATWQGAVDESAVPSYGDLISAYQAYEESENYSAFLEETALDDSCAYDLDAVHLTGMRMINMSDRDDVKRAIMNYGAAAAQIQFEYDYYNYSNSAYYCNDFQSTTHEVAIVGWDDSYSASNFGYSDSGHQGAVGDVDVPSSSTALNVGTTRLAFDEEDDETQWFSFIPPEDGVYSFKSSNSGGDPYAHVYCLDPSNSMLAILEYHDDDNGLDFDFEQELEAGQVYYLECGDWDATSYDLQISYLGASEPEQNDSQPTHDGAWLAKNSWGDEWGDDGYFWISYEDESFLQDWSNAAVFEVEPASNFDNNYQYDGTLQAGYLNYVDSGGAIGDIFEARANPGGAEMLKAVSFKLCDTNVDYSIQVFTDVRGDTDPTNGSPALRAPVTGKTSYAGYYMVPLPVPVYISEGTKYSIVVTLSHGDGSRVGYEIDVSDEQNTAVHTTNAVRNGQSFERDTASSAWDDLSSATADPDDEPSCSSRLKGFTDNVEAAAAALFSLEGEGVNLVVHDVEYTGSETHPVIVLTYGGAPLREGTDFEATFTDNVELGTATATIVGIGNYEGRLVREFEVKQADLASKKLTLSKSSFTYNGKVQKPTVKSIGGRALVEGVDYTLEYSNASSKAAGTYYVQVAGMGYCTGTAKATYKINKAANTMVARAKSPAVKASAVKVKARVIAKKNAFSVTRAKGKVTFKKASGNKKITVSKAGKVTVKKGLKKGTYKVKVKVIAAGNANYKALTKAVVLKVRVR